MNKICHRSFIWVDFFIQQALTVSVPQEYFWALGYDSVNDIDSPVALLDLIAF